MFTRYLWLLSGYNASVEESSGYKGASVDYITLIFCHQDLYEIGLSTPVLVED